eukprot:CAMPEP_0170516272 /NCGR_PEP_ID=MMETSP0209-20121228/2529_1 /TAXON_ID=665100 ORGANISM="Litonotus pictus, Strain P1" /NCGR_SAMPLE_ID=MMETSP0209 /ASSEMBLY_ACC=CAM_ASM_000301 /LENGTH=264 /DNA_ID=CAMNT_0010801091 /DNA_START=3 /DNA_END=794 /DNA_ORIENTATION=+
MSNNNTDIGKPFLDKVDELQKDVNLNPETKGKTNMNEENYNGMGYKNGSPFQDNPEAENKNPDKSNTEVHEISDAKIRIAKEENISNKELVWEILTISVPTILNFAALFSQQTINIIFVSKSIPDPDEQTNAIDGIGISNLYLNCTLLAVAIGLMNGFYILGGNAIGRGKFYLFGVYFHRCILVSYAFSIAIIIIHFFTIDQGLKLIGATGDSLDYSQSYARISMFYVFFEILFNSSFRYLNMARKGYFVVIVLFITTALHPLW